MNQDLATSKYFDASASLAPLELPKAPTAAPAERSFGLFQICRTLSMCVFIAVFTCGGVLLWTNRDDINDGAKSARRRTSNPIDFMLWLGGSDKTFEDAIVEASERQEAEWDRITDENKFEGFDLDQIENELIPLGSEDSDLDFSSDFEQ
ncbi:MAG: hypothetical protein SGJ19_26465 [Planctomycetia bacterium]|nr:hypothetical protein [Planctomycetia bacterium]